MTDTSHLHWLLIILHIHLIGSKWGYIIMSQNIVDLNYLFTCGSEESKAFLPWTANILTVNVSSGSCMVMQSMLIWMVFPADPSVGLSVKFSSIGWTEWMADLKQKGHIFKSPTFVFGIYTTMLFDTVNSLIQHIKQLVEHILTEGVRCLWWLILGHGTEERALFPGQARWRVSVSARRQERLWSFEFVLN